MNYSDFLQSLLFILLKDRNVVTKKVKFTSCGFCGVDVHCFLYYLSKFSCDSLEG